MKLLSSEILVTTEPIRDDAFDFWINYFRSSKEILCEFLELKYTLKMIKNKGLINSGKKFIQFTYLWDGKEWTFNVSDYFDKLCFKYCCYPNYLINRNI